MPDRLIIDGFGGYKVRFLRKTGEYNSVKESWKIKWIHTWKMKWNLLHIGSCREYSIYGTVLNKPPNIWLVYSEAREDSRTHGPKSTPRYHSTHQAS